MVGITEWGLLRPKKKQNHPRLGKFENEINKSILRKCTLVNEIQGGYHHLENRV